MTRLPRAFVGYADVDRCRNSRHINGYRKLLAVGRKIERVRKYGIPNRGFDEAFRQESVALFTDHAWRRTQIHDRGI